MLRMPVQLPRILKVAETSTKQHKCGLRSGSIIHPSTDLDIFCQISAQVCFSMILPKLWLNRVEANFTIMKEKPLTRTKSKMLCLNIISRVSHKISRRRWLYYNISNPISNKTMMKLKSNNWWPETKKTWLTKLFSSQVPSTLRSGWEPNMPSCSD